MLSFDLAALYIPQYNCILILSSGYYKISELSSPYIAFTFLLGRHQYKRLRREIVRTSISAQTNRRSKQAVLGILLCGIYRAEDKDRSNCTQVSTSVIIPLRSSPSAYLVLQRRLC